MSISLRPLRAATTCSALALALLAPASLAAPPATAPARPAPPTTAPAKPTTAPAKPTAPAGDLPSPQEIARRSIEAMGGRAALEKIKTAHLVAEVTVPMAPAPLAIETFWGRPGKALLRQSMTGMEMTRGADGKLGWATSSFTTEYQLLTATEAQNVFRDANPQMAMLEMDREIDQIKSVEHATIEDQPCYRVRFKGSDGMSAFFNAESGLLAALALEEPGHDHGPGGHAEHPVAETRMLFREWKEIAGVRMAHRIILQMPGMQGDMKFTTIEFNTVDPKVFEVPAEVARLAAARDAKATSQPATSQPSPTSAPALSPTMDRLAKRIASIDDPGQLRMIESLLEGQRGQLGDDELKELDYVVSLIQNRLAELTSGEDK